MTVDMSSRPSEVGLTGEGEEALVAAAREIGPGLRQTAGEGERERRLPAAAVTALADAGFFRLCRPRHLGGLEADPPTVLAAVEELARHDGSAAWCALNSGIAGALHSFLPSEGATETSGGGGDVVNGVIAPSGRAVERDGGYVVTGRWSFVSNCHQCTWLVPASIVFKGDEMSMTPDGPEIVMTFLRPGEWRIIDTWDTVGLRATGSHDIDVDEAFVPTHRTIPLPLPDPVADGALFRFPVVGLWSIGIAACALGIAQAAIDDLLDLAGTKTPFGLTTTLATRTTAQLAFCEGMAIVRAARALLHEETTVLWHQVRTGTPATAGQRASLRLAATHATTVSARAVELMYTAAGSTSVFASSPLQQRLRDVHAVTQHFFVAPPTYETIGKVLLGVEPDGFML